jgi:ubiquinone/menaquinone biosynthesis C-methylase UbiE
MAIDSGMALKAAVKEHWEDETCGTRYGSASDRKVYFDEISAARYDLEPYIPPFADFKSAEGKAVLEIGVGAGADFQNWCGYARHATGVDLTENAIALTRERLELNSIPPERYTLQTADAENLPFGAESFDLVYSWGVLHHTPDTARAFREAFRVLKAGGVVRAMIYHVPSWGGLMLYLRCGPARGNFGLTMKEAIFSDLESPGTKAYTLEEARQLLVEAGFEKISACSKLSPGDLLAVKPSKKYGSPIYKLIWRFYPRWLVRLIGDRYGLGLLLEAKKPALGLGAIRNGEG